MDGKRVAQQNNAYGQKGRAGKRPRQPTPEKSSQPMKISCTAICGDEAHCASRQPHLARKFRDAVDAHSKSVPADQPRTQFTSNEDLEEVIASQCKNRAGKINRGLAGDLPNATADAHEIQDIA